MRSVVLLGLLAACGGGETAGPAMVEVAVMPSAPTRELDILILMDDTTDPGDQVSFAAAMAAFLDRLAMLDGGLPDLHIAVATSDMGTSSTDPTIPGPTLGNCAGRGDDGLLTISNAPVTGAFLVDEDDLSGGRQRNYTGTLAETLTQMILVGIQGCGFEQHLAGLHRAITNPANRGFLRTTANLAIVVFADEDDCSVRDPGFFAPESAELGPLQSFRCTRFGLACDENLESVGPKTNCQSNADSPYVEDVGTYTALLDELLPARERVVVAGVFGPREPVKIELSATPGQTTPILSLASACTFPGAGGVHAPYPAVRLAQLVDHFGAHGALAALCQADLTPAGHEIARVTKQMFGVACIDSSTLADLAPEPGIQPRCEASLLDHVGSAPIAIPACRAGATGPAGAPCVEVVEDLAACPDTVDHLRVVITAPTAATADTYMTVRCERSPS